MPNPQNRNNRRKGEERSETLIIPHITKDMLDTARRMAEQGATRADIEKTIAAMQQGQPVQQNENPAAHKPKVQATSRPRMSEEEREAMRRQMQEQQQRKETETRREAARRTLDRPAWPSSPVNRRKKPAAPVQDTTRTVAIPAQKAEQPAQVTRLPQEPQTVPQETPAAQQPAPRPKQTPKRANAVPRSRTEAENDLNEKIRSDHIWLSNPVMVRGLGMAPVIGAALDGQRALILCVASLLLVTFTRVLAVAVCHLTNNRFRPVIYSYAAAILYIPVYILLYRLFGSNLTLLGIYLPILVVEPAIVKRMEFTELESVGEAFRHGFNNSLGMCTALLTVGCLRELLAAGTVFGYKLLSIAPLPLAAQPSGGFVIVGLIAAGWCAVVNLYTEYKHEEVRRLYAKH